MTLPLNEVTQSDALEFARSLPDECVDLVVTSPPYYALRDYGPFMGSGTTAIVALQESRNFIGSELNPEYVALANKRIGKETGWAKRVALDLVGVA